MAELAKGRLREKREQLDKALEGRVKPHHRFVLSELLCQIDNLDETIARFDAEIEKYCRPFEQAVELLDTHSWNSPPKRRSHRFRDRKRHEPLPNSRPSGGLGGCSARQ